MAFKLTLFLAAAIFIAMWFAPDAPEGDAPMAQATGNAPSTETARAPAEPLTPRDQSPETPPQGEAALAPQTPTVDPDAVASALSEAQDAELDQDAEDVARALDPLSTGSLALTGSASDAVSLADSVRARNEAPQGARQVPPQLDLSPPVEQITVAPDQGQPTAQTSALPVSVVTATSVNLRAGPSTSDSVVGRVSQGDRVEVIGPSSPGWTGIRHPERGDAVYIASQFLQPVN